jgi:hypothetical protein
VGGTALHPLEIIQAVRVAVRATRSDGKVANDIHIALHPDDHDRFHLDFDRLTAQVGRVLDGLEQREHLTRIGDRRVRFESSAIAAAGLPLVTARFTDTAHRASPSAAGATRKLARHSDAVLVFADGSRVAVTHTPFTIGRGPANDLVLADMAVSLRHVEIASTDAGFEIRDLGSRNGVMVDGVKIEKAQLAPGVEITLGATALRLEAANG